MRILFKLFRRKHKTVRRRKVSTASQLRYLANKEAARTLVHERLVQFNAHYNFEYRTVSIKNQRSKWGSCSSKKNLNFNYQIAHLPPHLADYVVVHELCHLAELNHSKKFWELVATVLPNWRALRAELKGIRIK